MSYGARRSFSQKHVYNSTGFGGGVRVVLGARGHEGSVFFFFFGGGGGGVRRKPGAMDPGRLPTAKLQGSLGIEVFRGLGFRGFGV